MSIGELIRSRREEIGLTQRDLAIRIESSQTVISFWERDAHVPKEEMAKKLRRVLKIKKSEWENALYGEEEEVTDPVITAIQESGLYSGFKEAFIAMYQAMLLASREY